VKPDPTFWSKLIQDLRHEKGWSQRELAQFANVNRTTLRSIEHGTGPVKMDIFERLLDALGHDLVALPREIPLDPAPSTDSEGDRSAPAREAPGAHSVAHDA
jgi:transcriptional regulator with XRE-family HTH domain